MKRRIREASWRLPDIIDLEYFLARDRSVEAAGGEELLKQRDRNLFLKDIAPDIPESSVPDTGIVLRKWLDAMRRSHKSHRGEPLPGKIWDELYHLFLWALFISGIITGAGIAFSLLSYGGRTPVNVFLFLTVLIFSQMGLLSAALIICAARKILRINPAASPSVALLTRIFTALSRRIAGTMRRNLPPEQNMNLKALTGSVMARKHIYGNLFFWPFFIMLQLFGTGFNTGALTATLLKVTGSDLAFGWQSTLQISSETVSGIVRFMALPWSWLLPAGTAFPDLAQIAGSRMFLKEGILRLATEDLVSWWPFLCMSLLFYGLLPRLAMLGWGKFMLAESLAGIRFKAACFRKTVQRMTIPSIESAGQPESPSETPEKGKEALHAPDVEQTKTGGNEKHPAHGSGTGHAARALILMPDDLMAGISEDILQAGARRLGLIPSGLFRLDEACDYLEEPCGEELRGIFAGPEKTDGILLLLEAWQPPIEETLSLIRDLRKLAGTGCLITVWLTGKPGPDRVLSPVKEQDFNIWQQRLRAIGDPELQVMELELPRR